MALVQAERSVFRRVPAACASRRARLRSADGVRVLQGARQGFALAFAGAVVALPCLSAKTALDTLHTHSEPVTGSAKVRRTHFAAL